jgi:hypothetical protein
MGMLCLSLGLRLIVLIDWQINRSYIAENLCEKRNEVNSCCQGKCQLKKRMDKLDKDYQQPTNEKKKSENEKNFDFFELPIEMTPLECPPVTSMACKSENLISSYQVLFIVSRFKPPSTILAGNFSGNHVVG